MKSDRTHGNQSLVFTMKVIVSQFVRDTHKVMTTLKLFVLVLVFLELIQLLPAQCFCGVFIAILWIYFMHHL
jgi:hypothetical protein